MMILADTSVWISHFRGSDRRLQTLLDEGGVLMHPVVIGELACGNLPRRSRTLIDLQSLPPVASIADVEETMFVIESRNLWGKGIGWADGQLVASALLSGCELWTLDKRLREIAVALRIASVQSSQ
jgi:predicted nucleic acid-binding protein